MGGIGFVLSHPSPEESEEWGTRGLCFPRSQRRDRGHPFFVADLAPLRSGATCLPSCRQNLTAPTFHPPVCVTQI